jgi:hypothetical protein
MSSERMSNLFATPQLDLDLGDRLYKLERTRAKNRVGFYSHVGNYLFINAILAAVNLTFTPSHFWFIYVLAVWGLVLLMHGLSVVLSGFTVVQKLEEKFIAKEVAICAAKARLSASEKPKFEPTGAWDEVETESEAVAESVSEPTQTATPTGRNESADGNRNRDDNRDNRNGGQGNNRRPDFRNNRYSNNRRDGGNKNNRDNRNGQGGSPAGN